MAKRLKLSRTSFYWFFQDRQDVMQALLDLWADTNTKPIQDASNAYAETMVEAVLNVTYTLISEVEYDPRFDAAIRGWAIQSSEVNARLVAEDEKRVDAIRQMMIRHGFNQVEADVRAHAIYLVQLGYTSMQIKEDWENRIARVPYYMRTLAGLSRQRPNLPVFGRNSRIWIPLTNREATERIFVSSLKLSTRPWAVNRAEVTKPPPFRTGVGWINRD
jgi:AcrR family transcriptional regulator